MANVVGMQNSSNPLLQAMAPLLMQQLLAPAASGRAATLAQLTPPGQPNPNDPSTWQY